MYDTIPLMPPDPVLGLVAEFNAMTHPQKVNLGVGIYQNEKGHNTPFKAVCEIENELASEELPKGYLPIEGDHGYLKAVTQLILGDADHNDLISIQSVGGTSALSTAGKFLKESGSSIIYIPKPTWPNHKQIFQALGYEIRHYDHLDFEALKDAPAKSIILVHACCHNPTGIDPTKKQWIELFDIVKEQKAALLFDNAYQGFGKGFEEDGWAMRESLKHPIHTLFASSFSKNFGLYGERIGVLSIKTSYSEEKERLLSFIKTLIRVNYSNPPLQGSRIVRGILESSSSKSLWLAELEEKRVRLKNIRKLLGSVLPDFPDQQGLFSLTGFSSAEVLWLKETKGILMPKSGRMNISGVNDTNLKYVIESFREAISLR